jgi:protoporphyrinogen/coproporphyrinogen III oxidase
LPDPSAPRPRVAVVGGGITGLATAWFLRDAADVVLLEADDRVGGKIATAELAGVPVETGPDTFLARVPEAAALCRAIGLGDDLVPPATSKAYLWSRGRLRPLPQGQVLGVPTMAGPLVRSGVLSAAGMARAALDLVLPRRALGPDPSVAEVVGGRLGAEVLERLVDPLVGGIHAGRTERLSLAATAPQLASAAASSRSLVLGLRRGLAAAADGPPMFLGVSGGMSRVVDRLSTALAGEVDVRTGAGVASIERMAPAGWRLKGPDVDADAVVLTVPAFAAARLVRSACPAAAAELDGIGYASVAVSTLAYRPSAVARALDGSGFLVPRSEGRLMTACTWSTSKWPELGRSGLVLLRPSAGRFGDDGALALDDAEMVDRLHGELAQSVGVTEPPVASLVTRWAKAFPQYEPGHTARVARVESALAGAMPRVVVAGAAYRGLGIAACVRQAEQAAAAVLAGDRARSGG